MRQYDLELSRIDDQLKLVEKVSKSFNVTAGYIIQLARHNAELFERSELEERRQFIKLVLLNTRWNG